MSAYGLDANGNPIIITPDIVTQELYSYLTASPSASEVKSVQPAAAGESDITFSKKTTATVVSSTVDVYVNFDQANTSATTGFYIPAKVPTKLPGCTKLNVYATAAGTVTAVGEH